MSLDANGESVPARSSLVSNTSSLSAPPARECWRRIEPTSKLSMMWWTARWKSLYGRWAFVVVGEVPLLGAAERCDWGKEGLFLIGQLAFPIV